MDNHNTTASQICDALIALLDRHIPSNTPIPKLMNYLDTFNRNSSELAKELGVQYQPQNHHLKERKRLERIAIERISEANRKGFKMPPLLDNYSN